MILQKLYADLGLGKLDVFI